MSLFKDATEILDNGNNKQVKSIKDTNGDIIWGSLTAFPYRRLEYIQSTGKQAYNTGFVATNTSYMILEMEDMDTVDSPNGRGNTPSNWRFAAGYRTNGTQHVFRFGLGNGWFDGPTRSAGKHFIGLQGNQCNVLNGAVGTSTKKQGYSIDGTFTQTNQTIGSTTPGVNDSLFLLGSRGNQSGSIQEPCLCKMYSAEYGHTSGTSQVVDKKFYPCQRKSDNMLGFYDVINNVFLYQLVSDSASGTLIAGPSVDEYWDLTAPS